jgi:hypothetical protein
MGIVKNGVAVIAGIDDHVKILFEADSLPVKPRELQNIG